MRAVLAAATCAVAFMVQKASAVHENIDSEAEEVAVVEKDGKRCCCADNYCRLFEEKFLYKRFWGKKTCPRLCMSEDVEEVSASKDPEKCTTVPGEKGVVSFKPCAKARHSPDSCSENVIFSGKKCSEGHTPESEWDSKPFVIDEMKWDGKNLRRASIRLQRDKHVVLEAVRQNGWALEYASKELKDDKEVVLEAVRQNGWALEYASEELKGDREVVLQAVRQNWLALRYASEELKDDKEVVLEAVRQNGLALGYASEELRGDKNVVLEAMRQNGRALIYASKELKGDEDVVFAAKLLQ